MFKRVVNTPGFWKSVFSLAIAFGLLFVVVKWGIDGFNMDFFTERNPWIFLITVLFAGLIYGFLVTFGKFRGKLKEMDSKK